MNSHAKAYPACNGARQAARRMMHVWVVGWFHADCTGLRAHDRDRPLLAQIASSRIPVRLQDWVPSTEELPVSTYPSVWDFPRHIALAGTSAKSLQPPDCRDEGRNSLRPKEYAGTNL